MSEAPVWKRALREPNAIGWIVLFLVVIAVGFGSLYVGSSASGPAEPDIHHATK
jgi:hypothetical protein